MKKLLQITFFLFSISGFSQQRKVDSLLTLLRKDKSGTTQINHLLTLCDEYPFIGEYDSAIHYGNKALLLCNGQNLQGLKAKALNGIGIAYFYQGDYPKTLEYYFQSLKIKEQIGDKSEIAKTIGNIGTVYWRQGNYSKTLEYYFKALKTFEEVGNKNKITVILSNIGIVYKEQGDNPKALEYYFKALKMDEELGRKNGIAANLNNIGTVYYQQGDNTKALECFFKGLKMADELGDKQSQANTFGNIGVIYSAQADYPKALEYYFKALKINEEMGDKSGMTIELGNIGSAYTKQKKYAQAEHYLLKSLALAREIGSLADIKEGHQLLSELYFEKGEYKNAYEHHQQYSNAKDSLLNEESSKQIAEMQTKYETEKKEQQITLLNKDKELQDAQLNRQKIVIWSVVGGLLIVVFLSIFIFRERKKSEKLLLNILPAETARELKANGKAKAKHYESVTVMFTDFKGFTTIAEKLSAEELVSELDFLFKKFDEIISRYNIEKIKTIGDAYMCASGLPTPNSNHAEEIVKAGIEIQSWMKEQNNKWSLRMGIHS
ncbi:MAG: tetratricopeptide repeat protein, partial [Bacteroidetes bacterium]|nr:tetratricopeptide repeat protein [Bacteroidota bacterium]